MRVLRFFGRAIVLAWLALAGSAWASTQVRVLETWPAGEQVQLASGQAFYLRLAYDTDTPVQLGVRPFWRGAPAEAGVNLSRAYTGQGEALASFFFLRPNAQVDEVRITVDDGVQAGTRQVAVWRGLVSGGGSAAPPPEPAWLTPLREQDLAVQKQEWAQRRPPRTPPGQALFGMGVTLVVAGAFVLGLGAPAWALWRWRGGWRLAATVPAAVMGFVVLRVLTSGQQDAAARSQWPAEIALVGLLCALAMGVLWLLRRRLGAARQPRA